MPIPNGIFVPSFLVGAGFGRLVGECFNVWFPEGLDGQPVSPGGYALVGAAAMSGAVTHTVSTSVICFELTGQISHSIPVLIAVILSNIVAQCLQPSMYDSIIQIKQLPFLPDIVSASHNVYNIMAEDLMQGRFHYIWFCQSYKSVYATIKDLPKTEILPLVESPESMVLLGTVKVRLLQDKINYHIGKESQLEFIENGKPFDELNHQVAEAKRTRKIDREHGKRHSVGALFEQSLRDSKRKIKPLANMFSGSLADVAGTQDTYTKHSSQGSLAQRHMAFAAANSEDTGIDEPGMSREEVLEWEELRMKLPVNFEFNEIDPSPFTIVSMTSLPKIHSMFSLLGLNKAYATIMGKLVGVITLNDIRIAVEKSSKFSFDVNEDSGDSGSGQSSTRTEEEPVKSGTTQQTTGRFTATRIHEDHQD